MNQLTTYFKNNLRQNGMVMALVFIMVLFQILTGGILFRSMNVNNLILQNAYVLILATGMLLCILTGNIDLSVGSVVAFIGAVVAVMMVDWGLPVPVGNFSCFSIRNCNRCFSWLFYCLHAYSCFYCNACRYAHLARTDYGNTEGTNQGAV